MRWGAGLGMVLLAAACPATAGAAVLPPATIDTLPGPAPSLAVAPDGTGALAYVKTVGGDDRIYVATLDANGTWSAPARVDADNGDDESAPRIAVGNGGRVLVGWLDNAGVQLKWRLRPATGGAFTGEDVLRVAAGTIQGDWDLDMNPGGVAYAAWTEFNPGTMKRDLRAWRLEGTTDAGSLRLQRDPNTTGVFDGSNGPYVRVAVDASGRAGVLYADELENTLFLRLDDVTRQGDYVDVEVPSVLGEALSGTHQQLDLDLAGTGLAWTAGAAMYPNGGHVVGRPVTGTTAGAPAVFDLHPASENDNAERPDVALNGAGTGLFAGEPNLTAGVWGGTLSASGASAPQRLDVSPHDEGAIENAAAAAGEGGTGLVAWTRDVGDGAIGPTQVRARVLRGGTFAPEELLLSSPTTADGEIPFAATNGDAAGASRLGDAAVLMYEDDGERLAVGRYDAPPTAPGLVGLGPDRVLRWTPSEAIWSPVTAYRLVIDEQAVATYGAGTTSAPLPNVAGGVPHSWRVVAIDTTGQETSSATGAFIDPGPGVGPIVVPPPPPRTVDRKKPTAKLSLTRRGRTITFRIRASDAGGIRRIVLSFGRRGVKAVRRTKAFTLRKRLRPGLYRLRLSVTDRAGNVTVVKRRLTIR